MSKLLRGDFIKLIKSKAFWIGNIFMFCFAALAVYTKWSDTQLVPDYHNPPDGVFMAGAVYLPIVISIFIGLYVGADYSDGTVRNKSIMGHSRVNMYLSNLYICTFTCIVMHLVFQVVIIARRVLGIIRKFDMSWGSVIAQMLISSFSIRAVTAIILFICMIIPQRSTAVVRSFVAALILILSASSIDNALLEEEYYTGYSINVSEDGELVYTPQSSEKNPKYVTGTKRKVLETVNDILPVNQIFQLVEGRPGQPKGIENESYTNFFPLYSLGIYCAVTAVGIYFFRKKDLK